MFALLAYLLTALTLRNSAVWTTYHVILLFILTVHTMAYTD